jgi:hypothetical protein
VKENLFRHVHPSYKKKEKKRKEKEATTNPNHSKFTARRMRFLIDELLKNMAPGDRA